MNRGEIEFLRAIHGDPAISILMPTHRRAPGNRQDPIRLKQLVNQAADQLREKRPRHEIEPLLIMLEKLMRQIDYRKVLDGLALFVTCDFARYWDLPFAVDERVVIADTFAVRDLMRAWNQSPRYWVLVLSTRSTRLFEGWRDTLLPVNAYGFPMKGQASPNSKLEPGGYRIENFKHRDERDRQFFRQVDEALSHMAKIETLPLFLIGLERWLALFQQITNHSHLIAGSLSGNHTRTPAHELARLVAPLLESHSAKQKQLALEELGKAVGAGRCISGFEASNRRAQDIYGATLLVEKNGPIPKTNELEQMTLAFKTVPVESKPGNPMDDLIELVLGHKGHILFLDKGMLEAHHGVAMIMPY